MATVPGAPEPDAAPLCWAGMPDQSRPAPIVGALIAAAAMLYAAARRKETSYAAARRQETSPGRSGPAPRPGWSRILTDAWREIDRDHIPVMAAGVAFYAFLSIFPAMSALISVYGLVADPAIIGSQVSSLAGVLPQAALDLLSAQLNALISAPRNGLGIGLIISVVLALWSAMSGTGTLMQALTVAYEQEEKRGIIGFYGTSALLTVGIAVFGLLSLFMIAVVPAVIDWLPFPQAWLDAVDLVRWPVLAGLVLVLLAAFYRFAPSRRAEHWDWFAPGTIAAAVLWLVASAGFSFYVARFASYDKTYGSLGAVAILLVWLYVSAYIVLAGAELNAVAEGARSRREPAALPA
jgi:membrane protein